MINLTWAANLQMPAYKLVWGRSLFTCGTQVLNPLWHPPQNLSFLCGATLLMGPRMSSYLLSSSIVFDASKLGAWPGSPIILESTVRVER